MLLELLLIDRSVRTAKDPCRNGSVTIITAEDQGLFDCLIMLCFNISSSNFMNILSSTFVNFLLTGSILTTLGASSSGQSFIIDTYGLSATSVNKIEVSSDGLLSRYSPSEDVSFYYDNLLRLWIGRTNLILTMHHVPYIHK